MGHLGSLAEALPPVGCITNLIFANPMFLANNIELLQKQTLVNIAEKTHTI